MAVQLLCRRTFPETHSPPGKASSATPSPSQRRLSRVVIPSLFSCHPFALSPVIPSLLLCHPERSEGSALLVKLCLPAQGKLWAERRPALSAAEQILRRFA